MSGLTDEDFIRLQSELNEFKVKSIESEKEVNKLKSENVKYKEYAVAAKKERERIENILNKSRQMKNNYSVVNENENLKSTLESSQEDFKLQIKAMRDNLTEQFKTNQKLEKELTTLRKAVNDDGTSRIPELESINEELTETIRKLTAEKEEAEVQIIALNAVTSANAVPASESDGEAPSADSSEIISLRLEVETWKEKYSRINETYENSSKSLERDNTDLKQSLSSLKDLKKVLDQQLEKANLKIDEAESQLKSNSSVSQNELETISQKVTKSEEQALKAVLELEQVRKEKDELQSKVQKSQEELDMVVDKYQQIVVEHNELTKTANSRKEMVEEISRAKNELQNAHLEDLKQKNSERTAEMENIEKEYNTHLAELEGLQKDAKERYQNLLKEHKNLIKEKKFKEKELLSSLATAEELNSAFESSSQKINELETTLGCIYELYQKQSCEFELSINEINNLLDQEREESESLKIKLQDSIAAEKLAEKKGVALIRDLKREVRQNRHKLQKLELEVLDYRKGNATTLDIPGRRSMDSYSDDISQLSMSRNESELSISSLASINGHSASSNFEENPFIQQLQNDNQHLISKLSESQCQIALYREKIAFLEENSSSLARENADRKDVIQKYVLSRGVETEPVNKRPSSVPSSTTETIIDQLSLIKDRLQTNQHQKYNDKLQQLLEGTLMKNMQLQDNLKILAQENTELRSKLIKE